MAVNIVVLLIYQKRKVADEMDFRMDIPSNIKSLIKNKPNLSREVVCAMFSDAGLWCDFMARFEAYGYSKELRNKLDKIQDVDFLTKFINTDDFLNDLKIIEVDKSDGYVLFSVFFTVDAINLMNALENMEVA